MVGADICEFKGDQYLIVSDNFSRYIEIAHLKNANSFCVIQSMKNIFARHGIPEKVVKDNGRQFVSSEFQNFVDKWDFVHTTSSPYFPQSNGQAERAVRITKRILQQEDPFHALLSYRTTATSKTAVSPAELAMGQKLRTTLPAHLEPKKIETKKLKDRDEKAKNANKKYFDRRHEAKNLPELHLGDIVLQKLDHERQWQNPATVLREVAPRSYIVQTSSGNQYRRNRKHLRLSRQPRLDTGLSTKNNVIPTTNLSRSRSTGSTLGYASPAARPPVSSEQPSPEADVERLHNPKEHQEVPSYISSPVKTTRRGRRIKTPQRFKDYAMQF